MSKPVSESFVFATLSLARGSIETGEPYYQPQDYAVAAQEGCDEAAEEVRREGLTPDVLHLVGLVVREAAKCTAGDFEAVLLLRRLAQIEGRPADFESARAEYDALDKSLPI